jgi:hypothetical protein
MFHILFTDPVRAMILITLFKSISQSIKHKLRTQVLVLTHSQYGTYATKMLQAGDLDQVKDQTSAHRDPSKHPDPVCTICHPQLERVLEHQWVCAQVTTQSLLNLKSLVPEHTNQLKLHEGLGFL